MIALRHRPNSLTRKTTTERASALADAILAGDARQAVGLARQLKQQQATDQRRKAEAHAGEQAMRLQRQVRR